MFCGKCGTKNVDDAVLCIGCGAKINDGQSEKTSIATDSNAKNRKVGMIAVAAIAAVVVVIAAVLIFGGRSYNKATTVEQLVEQYSEAYLKADAEALLDLVPEEVIDYISEEYGRDEDKVIENIQRRFDYDDLPLDAEAPYEIEEVEDVTGEDFFNLQDSYGDMGIKVSAAKLVTFSPARGFINCSEHLVIKVGRFWYMPNL